MVARKPPFSPSLNVMSPPWLRAMSRAIANPNPVPASSRFRASSRRKKGRNTSSRMFSGMPGPSSATMMRNVFCARDPVMVMLSAYLQALLTILAMRRLKAFGLREACRAELAKSSMFLPECSAS